MKNLLLAGVVACCLSSIQAAASGKIIKVKTTSEDLEITIETTVGESYQIQCRSSLVSGDWSDVGTNFVAVGTNTIYSVATSESHCYLRVVRTSNNEPLIAPSPPPPPPPPPPNI